MRRSTPKPSESLRSSTSWVSWKKCKNCSMEFKFEKGWVFTVAFGSCKTDYHLCAECAPTRDDAIEIIDILFAAPTPINPPNTR